MGWIVFGVILLIIALIFLSVARGERGKLTAISAADTLDSKSLADLHERVTTTLGTDVFAQVVEVVGTIECDAPLTSPVGSKPCVSYTYTLTREYEEDVTETDAQGKQTSSVQKKSETLQSETKQVEFWVRDATGRVRVVPDGAEVDLSESNERFESAYAAGGKTRTIGRRHRETLLPVGVQVFILGTAVDRAGSPAITKSPKEGKFLISRKSERELTQDAAGSAKGYTIATAVCGVGGLLAILIGLVSR
jgi:E3 Ubiquitin ligase